MQLSHSLPPLDLGPIITGLGGGLALFLFGMRQMTESLKIVAGHSMKRLLASLTRNRFSAALAGLLITAVIQSSSVTTVLVVGFVSADLLTLGQSIGVIIGANVGTTITAQIIAFNVYKYGLLLIAIGFLVNLVPRHERIQHWGMALMGLGIIFYGMELMSSATLPLRDWPPFVTWMQNLHNPWLAIVLGTVFTAIVQSSSATTGIVIVLASQGMISLETGIGLCLGANVGTCVTSILACIGRPRPAVQVAWVHVVFNVGGVVLWMFFIPQFAELVRQVSPRSQLPLAADAMAVEMPRQIAIAHTLFNTGNALLFIWFTGPLAKLMDWLVPARVEPTRVEPKYLDASYLAQPSLALDQVQRELVRLAELAQTMLGRALTVAITGSRAQVDRLESADDDIDALYGSIVTYLGKLSQQPLVAPQPQQLQALISIANYLENTGDVIQNELVVEAKARLRNSVVISPATVNVLRPLHEHVCWAFGRALAGLASSDAIAAREAVESKARVNELSEVATSHLARRLGAYEPNRLAAFKVETGIIEDLRRINTLTRRIARAVLEIENGGE
jgi:phosphate:Na+ symporter